MTRTPLTIATLAACLAIGAAPEPPGGARPNRWGYGYPRSYDAEIAAPDVHRIHYEDDHIMVMEVGNPPGYKMQMHGHPYPSVFARMSGGTTAQGLSPSERFLDPANKTMNGQNWRNGPPPKGQAFPDCTAADPQAPHLPVNAGAAPLHFYRIEFKRIDQDATGAMHALYAGKPLVQRRYEDDAVRVLEVTIPPGGRDPARLMTSPAVLAFDTAVAFEALDRATTPDAGRSPPPHGMAMPRCMTLAANQGVPIDNRGALPIHYYRIEFKRIDGADLKDHWREWYPNMAKMQ